MSQVDPRPVMCLLCASAAENSSSRRIIIAGGGTGGHLFPGIAVAREFLAAQPQNRVLFVSTGNPFERATLERAGLSLESVTVAGIKGLGLWKKMKALLILPVGIAQAIAIIRRFDPDLIIGMGSYSAGPVVLGGWLTGKRIALHEQNQLPGITNRKLARFASRIYVSFEETMAVFPAEKARLTGNPVRGEIVAAAAQPAPSGEYAAPLNVLIVGGSQGAHAINMAVIESLPFLQDKDRYHFVHQTGETDEQAVKDAYRRNGIDGTVQAFFEDMDRWYRMADLLICRAGATTVAEITAVGKAAVFIPFPYAADDHQTVNARALADRGAAEVIEQKDLTGSLLASKIEHYANHRDALAVMARKARELGKPEAARRIVEDCYRLMGAEAAVG